MEQNSNGPIAAVPVIETRTTRRMGLARKIFLMVFTVALLIPTGVVLIVNLAIERQITWAVFPLLSIGFVWLSVAVPLVIGRFRPWLSLVFFTAFLLLFLNAMDAVTPGASWFHDIALPAALILISAIWLIYFVWRALRINRWLKASISVIILGILNGISHVWPNSWSYDEGWVQMITLISSSFFWLVLAAIFGIIGFAKQNKIKE